VGRPIDHEAALDLQTLASVLVYGTSRSRRRLASRLLRADGDAEIRLLAGTVRSCDPWQLRARSLEVLGLLAGGGDRATAESVLIALLGPDSVDAASTSHHSGRGDTPV
jgi:hypothetical protein